MIELSECQLINLDNYKNEVKFDCGHKDLNEFFSDDAKFYSRQLLGKNYFFVKDKSEIVSAFTLSNDRLVLDKLGRSRSKISEVIPNEKRRKSYPSVLLGRFGVHKNYSGEVLGRQVMDFLKAWFLTGNKTGCRFLTVDAYNEEAPLGFYRDKCQFQFLYSSEEDERKGRLRKDEILKTRTMLFDLALLRP